MPENGMDWVVGNLRGVDVAISVTAEKTKESAVKVYRELFELEKNYQMGIIKERIAANDAFEDYAIDRAKKRANAQIAEIDRQLESLDKLLADKRNDDKYQDEQLKIDRLKARIEYEHDDVTKLSLQKELDRAEKSRADRLFELEIKEQKELLTQQKADVKERLEGDIDRIKATAKLEREMYTEQLNWLKLQSASTVDVSAKYMRDSLIDNLKDVDVYFNNMLTRMFEDVQGLMQYGGGGKSSTTNNNTFSPTYNLSSTGLTPAQAADVARHEYNAVRMNGIW